MRYPAALPAIALGIGISTGVWLQASVHPFFLAIIWLAALLGFVVEDAKFATACVTVGFLGCGTFFGARADSCFARHPAPRAL